MTKDLGDASCWFGMVKSTAFRAVDNVDLDLYPGENLGIVGGRGSGKSILGRMLMRIIDPVSGSISYKDCDGESKTS